MHNTISRNRQSFGEWTKLYTNENNDKKILDNNINNEKEKYEKFVLNNEAFNRMKKSLPLVTGNSNILNLKTLKPEHDKNSETIDNNNNNNKNNFLLKNANKIRIKNESVILNFCQRIIKNNFMTLNDEIDKYIEDNDCITMQKSVKIKFDLN